MKFKDNNIHKAFIMLSETFNLFEIDSDIGVQPNKFQFINKKCMQTYFCTHCAYVVFVFISALRTVLFAYSRYVAQCVCGY